MNNFNHEVTFFTKHPYLVHLAFRAAYFGDSIYLYVPDEQTFIQLEKELANASKFFQDYYGNHSKTIDAFNRVFFIEDATEAVQNKDIIVTSEENKAFYKQVLQCAYSNTVFITTVTGPVSNKVMNSSSNIVACRFSNANWEADVVEVMPKINTSQTVLKKTMCWCKGMSLTPLLLKKANEQFVFDAFRNTLTQVAIDLYKSGVADKETIDACLTEQTGAYVGPFGMMNAEKQYKH
ncbi:3-hydroxyacyl-CoA dehydrogenase NAD-binding domain-containing protein [Terribacillus aidingensis]|uniref:3-hydroxyacyl-CoA dehydrogenase NAD-binding domain-containing protein n=1 Tax=Terribacillus aidingensis TaxID=586416 RepID=UPI00344B94F5